MPRPKPEEDMKYLGLQITVKRLNQLKKLASKTKLSVSWHVRNIINEYFERGK